MDKRSTNIGAERVSESLITPQCGRLTRSINLFRINAKAFFQEMKTRESKDRRRLLVHLTISMVITIGNALQVTGLIVLSIFSLIVYAAVASGSTMTFDPTFSFCLIFYPIGFLCQYIGNIVMIYIPQEGCAVYDDTDDDVDYEEECR